MASTETKETEISLPNLNESSAKAPPRPGEGGCCDMEDPRTKCGTFWFGLFMMSVAANLLILGFYTDGISSNPTDKGPGGNLGGPGGKEIKEASTSSKILLTVGFIVALIGIFSFVMGVLMLCNADCLYNEDRFLTDEDFEKYSSSCDKPAKK